MRRTALMAILFGGFVGSFLVIFRPFGLYSVDRKYDIYLWGFGAVTALAVFFIQGFLPLIFPGFFKESKWTVGREIGITFFNIWVIAGLNVLYAGWLNPGNLTWRAYVDFLWMTLAVGLIPVAIGVAYRQRRLERQYQEDASSIHPHPGGVKHNGSVTIKGDNQGEVLELDPGDLIAGQAEGNYLTLFFISNGRISKVVFRMTLRQLDTLFNDQPEIAIVHRSWMVNLDRVDHVTGNSQGLLLHFKDWDEEVPVARRRVREVKDWFVSRPSPLAG